MRTALASGVIRMFGLDNPPPKTHTIVAVAADRTDQPTATHASIPSKNSLFDTNPYKVATSFVEVLLRDQLSGYDSFALRTDSYTDKATGITHAFFRQIVYGLEVVDGDMSVNVKKGVIISHSDSASIVVDLLEHLY